ncbi:sigma-70 family RNA polymerase sigma factor [Porticoccaceae bacterium LTM1]|nr:sigma-70 family RNA polymerase sigma factor [Porticoccaceae bacterium LTM1]
MKTPSEKVVSLSERRLNKRELLDWLYQEYSQPMRGLFCARLGDRADIEDLLHDAFLRLTKMPDLVARVASGQGVNKSFMLTMANNLIIDKYRHLEVKKRYLDEESGGAADRVNDASPESIAHKHEVLKVIERALKALPKPIRDAFILSRFENLSHAQIGERLDLAPKTVETYIGKALLSVRNAVAELDGDGYE